MSLTSFSNIYLGTKVNKFFSLNGAVTVNTTLEMEENSYTRSEIVKRDIKNKLIEVIQARANNIGSGNLYVSGPFNPIPRSILKSLPPLLLALGSPWASSGAGFHLAQARCVAKGECGPKLY